jgi:hypothetical protein
MPCAAARSKQGAGAQVRATGQFQQRHIKIRTLACDEGASPSRSKSVRLVIVQGCATRQFEIHLVRPAVKSHCKIDGRCRVYSFEAHSVGDMSVHGLHFTFGPEPPIQAPSHLHEISFVSVRRLAGPPAGGVWSFGMSGWAPPASTLRQPG